jgi:hypothetical protein
MIWLLDHAANNKQRNADELARALTAHVNEARTNSELRHAPGRNTVNGWRRDVAKLPQQYDDKRAKGGADVH